MVIILWLMMINNNLVGGFEQPTPLKNDGVKVSWDDDIPNNQCIFDGVKVSWDDDIPNNQYMEKKTNVPNHQPDMVVPICSMCGIFTYITG